MKEKEDIEDENNGDKMEKMINQLGRDRVDDLANTASILGSWMSDQKLTIAEQLAIVELLRSSILVNYMQSMQTKAMSEFINEHPDAHVVMVNATKKPAPRPPRTFDPDSS